MKKSDTAAAKYTHARGPALRRAVQMPRRKKR
jgi:hypothetical protein